MSESGRGEPDQDPRALWLERAVLTSPDSETSQQFLVVLAAFASANTSSRHQEAEALPLLVGLLVSPAQGCPAAGTRSCVSQNEVSKRRSCCFRPWTHSPRLVCGFFSLLQVLGCCYI